LRSLWYSPSNRLAFIRRDVVVVAVLISSVAIFLWNSNSLMWTVVAGQDVAFRDGVRVISVALTLNVALILVGWRCYVDLQHEAALRADGESRAAMLVATDAITGLFNRKGFADGVHGLATHAATNGKSLVILSLQMQRFKTINDRHGYDIGDALLRRIAATLVMEIPADAVTARLSGDEFAVALAMAPEAVGEAEALCDVLLRGMARTYDIDGTLAQVGAFAGIAVQSEGHLARAADLLRRADIALDGARTARAARPVWFDDAMERALIAQSELEHAMRVGLEHGQFHPVFEPQVDLVTGRIIGFEMLARWQHPTLGTIGPDRFIPIAEDIGVIGQLSEQVILAALRTARNWSPGITLSVNISPSQLSDPWLAHRLLGLLTQAGFPAERLVVEITEGSLFSDMDLARTVVANLKTQGVRLALDDFGTGYSSLSHLRSLPLDVIKIDRSFVSNLCQDRESAAIVKAVCALAGAIGVPVTAEGIEDAETHVAVLALGAKTGQGWFFGKPMSAEQAAEMLARDADEGLPELGARIGRNAA
jgi:diguanylate cyclase (GGDEF)-like protein